MFGLVGRVKKWEGGKFFCLVGEKKRRMKNVIDIKAYNSSKKKEEKRTEKEEYDFEK